MDVHPLEFVTVKVYVPAVSPVTVPVVPDEPDGSEPEGIPVTDQVPVEGNPLNATLPVATVQVGWVIVPVTGAVGVTG